MNASLVACTTFTDNVWSPNILQKIFDKEVKAGYFHSTQAEDWVADPKNQRISQIFKKESELIEDRGSSGYKFQNESNLRGNRELKSVIRDESENQDDFHVRSQHIFNSTLDNKDESLIKQGDQRFFNNLRDSNSLIIAEENKRMIDNQFEAQAELNDKSNFAANNQKPLLFEGEENGSSNRITKRGPISAILGGNDNIGKGSRLSEKGKKVVEVDGKNIGENAGRNKESGIEDSQKKHGSNLGKSKIPGKSEPEDEKINNFSEKKDKGDFGSNKTGNNTSGVSKSNKQQTNLLLEKDFEYGEYKKLFDDESENKRIKSSALDQRLFLTSNDSSYSSNK